MEEKKVLSEDHMPERIGQLYSLHPTQIELYALQLLLNHVKGPTSDPDIWTVEGVTYDSFKDAAIALSLVKDDYIWIECMKEQQTNIHHIHQLFATIIAKCEVNIYKTFYKTCKGYLHRDFLHIYKLEFPKNPLLQKYIGKNATIESNDEVSLSDEDVVEDDKVVLETYENDDEWTLEKFASNSSLCDLEQILAKDDLSLKNFSLPVPNMKKEQFIQDCLQDHHDIAEENDLSVERAKMFYEANCTLLNKDQQQVFNYIKDFIVTKNKDGLLIFLDAPGGTGKTFTLNVLVTWMITESLKVATSAASGIAATLLFLLARQPITDSNFLSPLTRIQFATSRRNQIQESFSLIFHLVLLMRSNAKQAIS